MSELRLKAKLGGAIEKWAEDIAESPDFEEMNVILGRKTIDIMVDAAFAILVACADSQHAAIEGGLFKEA